MVLIFYAAVEIAHERSVNERFTYGLMGAHLIFQLVNRGRIENINKTFINNKVSITWMNQFSSIQLKRKIGRRNSCILSILTTDRHAASRGTNLLFSPFDCRGNFKYCGGLLLERLAFKR